MEPFNPLLLSRNRRSAFSLVELLVVITIMGLMSALTLPAINSAMRAYQLDSAGQMMVNQLNLARQTAISQGHAVQVRLYMLPDYNLPMTGTPVVYRGMQSFIEAEPIQAGTTVTVPMKPLIKPVFFQAPVIISTAVSPSPVSPILTSSTPTRPLPVDLVLPGYQSNYEYVTFHFKPDGSTDLSSVTNSLSLILENDKLAGNGLPSNFQTIQIDPLNGAVRAFRP